MQELGHEKQQQLDAGIFGVVAAHQFLLRLRQVERQPGRLGKAGHEKDEEAQRLCERIPDAALRLGVHDRVEFERSGCEHDAEEAEAERNLVGHELGTAPQTAQEAILVVAGPAAEQHAIDRDAR